MSTNAEQKMMQNVSDRQMYKKSQRHAMANMIRACEEMTSYFTIEECYLFAINCIHELTSDKDISSDINHLFQGVDENVLFSIPYRRIPK